MGGFVDSRKPNDKGRAAVCTEEDIREMTADSHPQFLELLAATPSSSPDHDTSLEPDTSPTPPPPKFRVLIEKAKLEDKSKGDYAAKLLAVLQTIWFIIEFIARWATRLPRTQLELVTIAYAVVNLLIYSLWWNKPLRAQEPIDVSGRSPILNRQIPESASTWVGPWDLVQEILQKAGDSTASRAASGGLSIAVGTVFGALHLFAWNFEFPSHADRLMWRVCSIFCTVSPFFVGAAIDSSLNNGLPVRPVLGHPMDAIAGIVLYSTSRLILLVITFRCLKAMPFGAYQATSWTVFFPHIG